MDQLEALLMGRPLQRKTISGGTTGGRVITEYERPKYKDDVVPEKTMRYAKPFVKEIRDQVWRRFENYTPRNTVKPEANNVYKKYDFSRHLDAPPLPIEDHKSEILAKVRENTVVVLRGPTGCGKTTKVPQFIIDDCRSRDLYCNIVVAQPRRIAASSNAKRVCKERGWKLGDLVGYQVGSDRRENCSEDTRILFCTTGVLVEKLIHGNRHNPLDQFTHVILDEVHERDKDMDFLMIAIYKYLNPKIRVILMSATIDVEKFAKYYQVPSKDFTAGKAPVIELGCKRNHNVTTIFMDEIEKMDYEQRMNTPEISEQMYKCALKCIVIFERIDRLHAKAAGIDMKTYENSAKPTVLIFLPGIFEIKQMFHRLEEWKILNDEARLVRIMLHSTGDPANSDYIMRPPVPKSRNIILATNIAESSITVPDVKYVIDFCLTRNLVMSPITNYPSLQLEWASRDNCQQRAGRTGRVMDGFCIRLVSRKFYHDKLVQSAKAEMVTSPLENIILKAKQLFPDNSAEEVLALAMDKPYLDEIHNAVLRLKEMGAMLLTTKGQTKDRDGDISYIGGIMSRLPIDVKLSKLIALGFCFDVESECIIIAAALNCSKSIFAHNRSKVVEAYTKRLEFADGSGSDLFALLNAYKMWWRKRKNGDFGDIDSLEFRDKKNVRAAEKQWAEENFLEVAALRECMDCVQDLRVRVRRMNLIEDNKKVTWNREEKYVVLKVVIAGAFYPNYYSRSTKSKRSSERETFKVIGGRDPTDTVYFSGYKDATFPHIYTKYFKDILIKNDVVSEKDAQNIVVSHDGCSEKVFLTFKKFGKEGDKKLYGSACNPGIVLTEVYKAIKLRSIKLEHQINVLSDRNTALSYAQRNGLDYSQDGRIFTKDESEFQNTIYPRINDEKVKGYIVHTENCGRFWLQPTKYLPEVNKIHQEINNANNDLEPFQQESDIAIGQVLAAAYPSDGSTVEYFRAKVLYIERNKETRTTTFEVRYLEFGNRRTCTFNDLRRFRGVSSNFLTLPPYCYLCSLAYVSPSQVNAPDGIWRLDANKEFVKKTDGIELEVEIYSVVNGIARVILHAKGENVNKYLIDISAAEYCEETYMSKYDHIQREIARTEVKSANYLSQSVVQHLQEEEIPTIKPPTNRDGRMHTIALKGPYSPLEIGLFGLTNNSSGVPNIEPHSVNHILLENEPNDQSEKYLVAVTSHLHDINSAVTLRQTTLMPNIRLFGPLMAAIFAPRMKLVRNATKTTFIKMITGLGLDGKGVCLSPDSNMQFDLDVELKNSDLESVNSIRSMIDTLLTNDTIFNSSKATIHGLKRKIQNDLIAVLSQRRHLIPDDSGSSMNIWNPYDHNELLYTPEEDVKNDKRILPAHPLIKLKNPDLEYLQRIKKHHNDLRQKRFSINENVLNRNERCLLCNVEIENGIRLHLISRQHKDGVKLCKAALQQLGK